jgi:predicted Zn-dependent protease
MNEPLPSKSWPALTGRKSGSVRLERDRVVFFHDDPLQGQFDLPFLGLRISVSGENSHHYYLNHPSKPEQEICVQTAEPIETIAAFGVRAAQEAISKSSQRKNSRLARLTSVGLILFFLFFGIPWMISLLPASVINAMVTLEKEKALGTIIFPLTAGNAIEEHPSLEPLLKISKKIISSNPELQSLDLRLHVSKDPVSNAFALPGQRIVVNTGLLESADSWLEVAGVLAHEIGHIEQRHNLRALAGKAGILIGMGCIALFTGPDFAYWLGSGSNLISLNYSREDEFSADLRGAYFLNQAGIGPEGLILFLKKELNQHPARNSWARTFSFLSTHPLIEERIHRLEKTESTAPAADPLSELALPPLKSHH